MSLYRTWRPKGFADLVGQDAVVRTLSTAIETGRLAHAYLFSGPRGSGKTSAAKILARCIECVHGPTPQPDNSCENCLAILAGTALDVLEIDAASNRGIDEIRALRDAVKFAPATMRMKVYIIDEAHMLTKEGANAFLKTLEEPPPYAVFILATTAPEALPPTILSRCQRYAFRRIPVATMIERMRTISAAEGIAIDDRALGAIAYRADGGLRDALTMLEQVAAFAAGPIDGATVDAAFGQTGREYARRLLSAVLDGVPVDALAAIDDASDAGTDMTGLIRATIAEFRHLLVARINPELLARDLAGDDAAAALERASATPQARLVRALRLLSEAFAAARGSGNARLELETAVLRFILQGEDPSLDALAARVASLEAGSGDDTPAPVRRAAPAATAAPRGTSRASARAAAPAPAVAPEPVPAAASARTRAFESSSAAAPSASRPVIAEPAVFRPAETLRAAPATHTDEMPSDEPMSLQKMQSLWTHVRARAEAQKVQLRTQLSQATVSAVDAAGVTLSLPNKMQADILKRDMGVLRDALGAVVGRPLEIRLSVENPRAASAAAEAAGAAEPVDLVRYASDTLPHGADMLRR